MGTLSLDIVTLLEENRKPISGTATGPNRDRESSTIRTLLVSGRYAVNPRLTLMLSLPYREIRSPKDVGGAAEKHIDRRFRGLGDALLLARQQLNADLPAADAYYAVVGLRLPTGSANPNHTWRARDGSRILSRDTVLQPGFGSLDPIVGLQWAQSRSRGRSLYAGALYRHTGGTNDYGYRFGDELQVTAGAALPLGGQLTFTPQFLAQFSGHDHDFRPLPGKPRGRVENTGGRWLYFMPNVRYGAFEVNVQIPVYRKTNGNILNPNVIVGLRTTTDLPLSRPARERRRSACRKGQTECETAAVPSSTAPCDAVTNAAPSGTPPCDETHPSEPDAGEDAR